MPRKEIEDSRCRCDKTLSQQRQRYFADDDQKCYAMPDDCCELVGLVADSSVMGDRDPSPLPDGREPFFVRAVRREMVLMSLHVQAGRCENVRKPGAEIAIGEEDG